MRTRRFASALLLGLLTAAACAKKVPVVKRPAPGLAMSEGVRLGSVMWPTAKTIIYCTQRVDDAARPVGVAGPCMRLEAGDAAATKILSWATLGRFDKSPPNHVPASLGGRCRIEIQQGQRNPALRSATLTWVTPTRREVLDDWMPTDENVAVEADAFTSEASFSPEGEWLAILHIAVGLGEGERVVQVASVRMMRIPACD